MYERSAAGYAPRNRLAHAAGERLWEAHTIRGSLSAKGAQYLDLCATPIGGVFISNTIDGVHLESSCALGVNPSATITGGSA